MEKSCNSTTALAEIKQPVFLIDWLTFTDFLHTSPQDVMSFLGLSLEKYPWVYEHRFRNGYPEHYFWNNITISFGADNERWYDDPAKIRTDMGICVNFSGQGCRAFETEGGDWLHLFKRFQGDIPWSAVHESPVDFCRVFKKDRRFNVTRLDLAFDDHTDYLDIYRIKSDITDRNYISKATYVDYTWSDHQKQDIQGLSIGIGSKKSKVYVRIYDKAAERGFKDRHWVRCELQLRDDRALVAMAQILDTGHVGRTVAGILRNYITFRTPSGDTNKSRWPIAYYWQRVIGQMEKMSLWIKPGEPYNIHKSEYWLKSQYGQLIATLSYIQDPDQLINDCRDIYPLDTLNKKYRQIVDEHERSCPASDPKIVYFNGGISVNGEFYPYEQQELEELFCETPWDNEGLRDAALDP